jgi:hypothetical protein
MAETQKPTREEILDAFSMEAEHGRLTLERYLGAYPEFAADLVDLSRELARSELNDDGPLSPRDEALIEAAWRGHEAALGRTGRLTAAPVETFREGKVIVSTVPRPFLAKLAATLDATVDQLLQELDGAALSGARSYKADQKPQANEAASFEQILIDAGVDETRRAELMAEN